MNRQWFWFMFSTPSTYNYEPPTITLGTYMKKLLPNDMILTFWYLNGYAPSDEHNLMRHTKHVHENLYTC